MKTLILLLLLEAIATFCAPAAELERNSAQADISASGFNIMPSSASPSCTRPGWQQPSFVVALVALSIVLGSAFIRERRHMRRLQQLAHVDHLTSLYNRRYLFSLGQRLLQRCQRDQQSFAAIMLDVDYFKQVNDRHGHSAGDQALVEIAEVCRNECRPSDIVGRFGGEEFLLLLPDTGAEEARRIAKRIGKQIQKIELLTATPVSETQLSASFGVACSRPHQVFGFEQLINQADSAMYQAKAGGRNQVHG